MNSQIIMLTQTREHFINFLRFYDLQTLNQIPEGFTNTIFWNAAHSLVTQQLLHYYLSENDLLIQQKWVESYKKGTKVNQPATRDDLEDLIELLSKTPKQLLTDYKNEKFAYYKPYETSYNIKIQNIEDAIAFNNMHESLHLGYVLAMKKHL